jgi:hypothetical protein
MQDERLGIGFIYSRLRAVCSCKQSNKYLKSTKIGKIFD